MAVINQFIMTNNYLQSRYLLGTNHKLSLEFFLVSLLVFGVLRLFVVGFSYMSQASYLLPPLFILMLLFPYMILDQKSRKQLWITPKTKKSFLIIGFLLGLCMALLVGFIGEGLFGQQISNWYIYIRESYRIDAMQNQSYLLVFTLSACISMIFSPLGEEVFFRGFVHQGLQTRFSPRFATVLDSAAFALVHLCHFGIVFQLGNWTFLPIPSLLWVLLMFLTALLFSFVRNKSNSLWGAILSHAGFNLGMTTYIFFLI